MRMKDILKLTKRKHNMATYRTFRLFNSTKANTKRYLLLIISVQNNSFIRLDTSNGLSEIRKNSEKGGNKDDVIRGIRCDW
jgi:hypothetical protein